MRLRLFIALAALLALGGCYTAEDSLLAGRETATPYEKISYRAQDKTEAPNVGIRRDGAYVTERDDGILVVRLLPVEADWYVVELSGGKKDEKPDFLYGYMKLELEKKIATVYVSLGDPKDQEAPPGIRPCGDKFCIDDLDAYIAFAKKSVADGRKPDTVYDITAE